MDAKQADANHGNGGAPSARPDGPPGAGTGHKPPRPEMSSLAPAPIRASPPPPRVVHAMRLAWVLSFVTGVAACLVAYFSRDATLAHLKALVAQRQPAGAEVAVDALVSTLFWVCLGTLLAVMALQALLVKVMMNRHGRLRWALLAVLPLHGFAVLLLDGFLVLPSAAGTALSVLLLAQLALVGTGLVLGVMDGASAWFRAK